MRHAVQIRSMVSLYVKKLDKVEMHPVEGHMQKFLEKLLGKTQHAFN